jgi:hypothetical protein
MGYVPDVYTLRARLLPALFVSLPIALLFVGLFPDLLKGWSAVWSIIVACGGTAMLAQLARDGGKRIEPALFKRWGGQPTVALLRHQGTTNRVLLHHRHKKLHTLTGYNIPSLEEEQQDPSAADAVYEACVISLRSRIRNREEAKLVFEEDCNYGFRRNLLGMKPLGVTASAVGLVGTIVASQFTDSFSSSPVTVFYGILNLFVLVLWLWVFNPRWVKTAADAYANSLLEACDTV